MPDERDESVGTWRLAVANGAVRRVEVRRVGPGRREATFDGLGEALLMGDDADAGDRIAAHATRLGLRWRELVPPGQMTRAELAQRFAELTSTEAECRLNLAAIQARADAADRGPWRAGTVESEAKVWAHDPEALGGPSVGERCVFVANEHFPHTANRVFAAAARQDVPDLVREIQRFVGIAWARGRMRQAALIRAEAAEAERDALRGAFDAAWRALALPPTPNVKRFADFVQRRHLRKVIEAQLRAFEAGAEAMRAACVARCADPETVQALREVRTPSMPEGDVG